MQEHPILKKPFYMLHPCRTAEVMAILRPSSPLASPSGKAASCNAGDEQPHEEFSSQDSHSIVHRNGALQQAFSSTELPGVLSMSSRQIADSSGVPLQARRKQEPTSELFAHCARSPRQLSYLEAWFSIFGPAVGLKLPFEMWGRPLAASSYSH